MFCPNKNNQNEEKQNVTSNASSPQDLFKCREASAQTTISMQEKDLEESEKKEMYKKPKPTYASFSIAFALMYVESWRSSILISSMQDAMYRAWKDENQSIKKTSDSKIVSKSRGYRKVATVR